MILDHIGFQVSHCEQSKASFSQALAPLGIDLVSDVHGWAGLGEAGKP